MFGGFAPFPLRLGGTAAEGWSAEQHARMAADVAAMSAVAPLATFGVDTSDGSIAFFESLWGAGSAHAPTVVVNSTGNITVTFPKFAEDELGNEYPIGIIGVAPDSMTEDRATTGVLGDPNELFLRCYSVTSASAADGEISVTVYGTWLPRVDVGHFDAALDKHDSQQERTPYAYAWYRELTDAVGSAFTDSTAGQVHTIKLAMARLAGHTTRAVERAKANSVPDTADEAVSDWRKITNTLALANESTQLVRERVASKFSSVRGNDPITVDGLIVALLGDLLETIVRSKGTDLDTPPASTFYNGGTPGVAASQVWQFDASGPSYVDETADFNSATAADVNPFPAGSDVSDAFYIGYTSRFSRLRLDNAGGTAGTVGTVMWEYWDTIPMNWIPLSGLSDGTLNFQKSVSDGQIVSWTEPSGNWGLTTVNGSASLYYVRARVTAGYTVHPVYDQGWIMWPSLGANTWRSDRAKLTINLSRPPANSEERERVYLHLPRLLDERLRASVDYEIVEP